MLGTNTLFVEAFFCIIEPESAFSKIDLEVVRYRRPFMPSGKDINHQNRHFPLAMLLFWCLSKFFFSFWNSCPEFQHNLCQNWAFPHAGSRVCVGVLPQFVVSKRNSSYLMDQYLTTVDQYLTTVLYFYIQLTAHALPDKKKGLLCTAFSCADSVIDMLRMTWINIAVGLPTNSPLLWLIITLLEN